MASILLEQNRQRKFEVGDLKKFYIIRETKGLRNFLNFWAHKVHSAILKNLRIDFNVSQNLTE